MGAAHRLAFVALRVSLRGKAKTAGAWLIPAESLADARTARDTAKKQLALGTDPAAARKERKRQAAFAEDRFKAIAAEWVAKLKREGRAQATITKKEWLISLADPILGHKRAVETKPMDVLSVLRVVELRGCCETARRLRSTIGDVFRYAIATGRAEVDPTSGL